VLAKGIAIRQTSFSKFVLKEKGVDPAQYSSNLSSLF
jgi:hypothetical protein